MSQYNETTLKDAIQALLKANGMESKMAETRLISSWKEVVGPTIAKHTYDLSIYQDKLFIKLDNATLKQELHYSKDQLINIVNDFAGKELVKEVVIR